MTFTNEEKPKLFTKPAILIFSILLSTFFGALLFAQNLIGVAKKKDIWGVISFSIIWNAILIRFLGKFIPNSLIVFGITNAIGGLILIFPFWNYYLQEIVDYKARKIWGPLILFVVLVGGFSAFLLLKKGQ